MSNIKEQMDYLDEMMELVNRYPHDELVSKVVYRSIQEHNELKLIAEKINKSKENLKRINRELCKLNSNE